MSSPLWISRCLLVVLFIFVGASAALAAPPSWEERVIHQWINRARVDPQADLATCGTNCSTAEKAPSCYTPVAPLQWSSNHGTAARFHSHSMAKMNFFGHNTPCVLRSDLASVYPESCDGSASCACSASGTTSVSSRTSRFGASFTGEIIAAGYSNPVDAFYGWLLEPVTSSAPCGYYQGSGYDTNGHRWLILKGGPSVGVGVGAGGGWGTYYTADFGGGGVASKIPSGAHTPKSGSTIDFWANWYDAAPPSRAEVVLDGVGRTMTLTRGTPTNGAWRAQVTGIGAGCHNYYFSFTATSGEAVRYPAAGAFGFGGAQCVDTVGAGASVRGDFNGDGSPDLVWRNGFTGAVNVWFMNGSTYAGGSNLFNVADSNWRIRGTGDFNKDGNADLVWRHATTGAVNIWYLSGTSYAGGANLFTVADLDWEIEAVADMNSDGNDDLVWRNRSTGAVNVWAMNGSAYSGGVNLFTVPLVWRIEGAGDFNGDGKADLIWRNTTTGAVNVWFLNDGSYLGGANLFTVADRNWSIQAVGDYNKDGKTDLIWRHDLTGGVSAWFLNGTSYLGGMSMFTVADGNWQIVAPK